jgi:RNA polymerase II subunit A small phosphatase-like protein
VEDRLVTSEGDEDSGFLGRLFRCCGCGGRGKGKGEGDEKERDDTRRNSDDGGRNSSIGMTSSPYATRRPAHWPKPQCMPNLGDVSPGDRGKNCLLLDLDETLVHSSTEYMPNHDYKIPVEIDGTVHTIYVLKRPGVDEFLRRVKPFYEVVVFTASLSKYANPLLDLLDVSRVVSKRLFREHCVFYQGHFVKDLSVINRAPNTAILVDNSPQSYAFQPENAIDCSSFIDDPADTELWRIADFLEGVKDCADVRTLCRHWREWLRQHPGKGK